MNTNPPMKQRNPLLALALSAILATTAGCGGDGGDGGSPGTQSDTGGTAGLSPDYLKGGLANGLTTGPNTALGTVLNVLTSSDAVKELQQEGSSLGITGLSAVSTRAADGGAGDYGSLADLLGGFDPTGGSGSGGSASGFIPDDASGGSGGDAAADYMNYVTGLIENSSVTDNGDGTYTIDPDESTICNAPDATADEKQICTAVVGQMDLFVSNVQSQNDQIVAATTDFRYDGTVVIRASYTQTTETLEFRMDGSKKLLQGYNAAAPTADQIDLPDVMEGSLRFAFEVFSDQHAKMTVSVPTTLKLKNTTAGEEFDTTITQTDKLLALDANGDTEQIELELGFGALELGFNDENDAGATFPVKFALDALSGKITIGQTTATVTGLTATSVKLTVDGNDALSLALQPLNASLNANNNLGSLTLGSALDFAMSTTNVRQYLDDTAPATETTNVTVTAPANTKLDELNDTNDIVKVSQGGPLEIDITGTSVTAAVTLDVTSGQCLTFAGDVPATTTCPGQ